MNSNNTSNHGIHPCYSLDPTTNEPTTTTPTTDEPTTAAPTTTEPTTDAPTTIEPTTTAPTTAAPTTNEPTTTTPTTNEPTTTAPTTNEPTDSRTTTIESTTSDSTTHKPATTNDTTNEPTNPSTGSELTPYHSVSLTISSVSDIVDVPPSENMFESESFGAVSVILISVLSLCLLIAGIAIVFLWRQKNVVEIEDNVTEGGDNYNDPHNAEPSAPVLDGNETKNVEQEASVSLQATEGV